MTNPTLQDYVPQGADGQPGPLRPSEQGWGGGGGVGGGVEGGGGEMGLYDHLFRPSLGHVMQVQQRETRERYHGDRTHLQQQLSELRLHPLHLHTSPLPPPSPAPSNASLSKRWRHPDSDFNAAPEKAAHRARLAKLEQQDTAASMMPVERGEGLEVLPPAHTDLHSNVPKKDTPRHPDDGSAQGETSGQRLKVPDSTLVPKRRDEQEPGEVQGGSGRNTLLPPIKVEDVSACETQAVVETEGVVAEEEGGAAVFSAGRPQPGGRRGDLPDPVEKKALRFAACTELKTPQGVKTPRGGKTLTKGVPPGPKKGRGATKRRKSLLKDRPPAAERPLRLPSLHYYQPDPRRPQWDSGRNQLHVKGRSTRLERSVVREDCLALSRRSVALPPVADRRRTEVRRSPPNPRGLTKARLQAADRLLSKPVPVLVMYAAESSPVNNAPRAERCVGEEEHFPLEPVSRSLYDLDDSDSVLTAFEDVEDRGMSGGRLELPPLPVVRLSESKLGGHQGLEPTTRHVPRLSLDQRAHSPGLMSVTTTGRSGVTGLTAASYMSLETLEWKGQYMASGNQTRKDRMLSEIVQIVRQRMRENEEDLKMAGRDLRPFDLQSEAEEDDATLWDRHAHTPSSGTATARSNAGQQPQRKLHHRSTKQRVAAAPGASQASGAKLHMYLQNLSQRRKATGQRSRRERVRFSLANMTIREITQSSMHTAAVRTPLAA